MQPYNPTERAGWEAIWQGDMIPPRYRSLAEPNASVVEWADTLPPNARVLDVGCGIGRHVLYLGERGFLPAGVDVSPTGVQITRELCAERQVAFDGHVADMTALPWDDNTFDGALSTSTIHHHLRAGILQALGEIRRVLKPGGTLLVDFPSTDSLICEILRRQAAAGEVREVEPNTFVDERPAPDDEDGFMPHHFCDGADLRDLLRGFEVVRLSLDLRQVSDGEHNGLRGKWVAWARKPGAGKPAIG